MDQSQQQQQMIMIQKRMLYHNFPGAKITVIKFIALLLRGRLQYGMIKKAHLCRGRFKDANDRIDPVAGSRSCLIVSQAHPFHHLWHAWNKLFFIRKAWWRDQSKTIIMLRRIQFPLLITPDLQDFQFYAFTMKQTKKNHYKPTPHCNSYRLC